MFRRKRKKRKELLNNYKKLKTGFFRFERIALFFQNSDNAEARQIISRKTLQDLDFEELFMVLDRTVSTVGQQYLYQQLMTIPKDGTRAQQLETTMDFLSQNPELKERVIIELNKLTDPGAYYLPRLFAERQIIQPKWLWLVPILSFLTVASIILFIVYPPAIIILIILLTINISIHFWNKQNIMGYSNVIPQLLILHQVCANLLKNGAFNQPREELSKALTSLKAVKRYSLFLKWDNGASDDLK